MDQALLSDDEEESANLRPQPARLTHKAEPCGAENLYLIERPIGAKGPHAYSRARSGGAQNNADETVCLVGPGRVGSRGRTRSRVADAAASQGRQGWARSPKAQSWRPKARPKPRHRRRRRLRRNRIRLARRPEIDESACVRRRMCSAAKAPVRESGEDRPHPHGLPNVLCSPAPCCAA